MAKKETQELAVRQDDKQLGGVLFAPHVSTVIATQTPDSEKERLPGKDFDYVRVGWMRRQMEAAFPMSWDVEFFETANAETLLKAKAIVVKARITVRHPATREPLMVKEAFGGVGVKFRKDTSEPLDLGNDYKSAQADAMKKALSLFGISSDVYEPVIEKREQAREEAAAQQIQASETVKKSVALDPEAGISKATWEFIVAEATNKKVSKEALLKFVVDNGWAADGKAKPSLIKNQDVPAIEKWLSDAPPF